MPGSFEVLRTTSARAAGLKLTVAAKQAAQRTPYSLILSPEAAQLRALPFPWDGHMAKNCAGVESGDDSCDNLSGMQAQIALFSTRNFGDQSVDIQYVN